tara:strand:+ start:41 stop:631 length:591 start_codon:yes stop_codon:yes gene_type:complete
MVHAFNPIKIVQNFSNKTYVFQKEIQKSIMRTFFYIFLFFVLAEILLIIAISNMLGFGITSILLVTSTALGIWMCRSRGLRSFNHAKIHYTQGMPLDDRVLESAGMSVSGFLLIIPGFVTSFIGLVILIPGLKAFMFQKVLWHLSEKLLPKHTKHNATFSYDDTVGTVVDGEYYETNKQNKEERSNEQSHINLEKS